MKKKEECYYCNPINFSYRYSFIRALGESGVRYRAFREAADPSIVEFNGIYYLFPSMTAGFLTSNDMIHWTMHNYIGDMPVYDYAPDVRVIGDYLYFSASKRSENCSFFRTKDPITQGFEEIKGTFPFWDPNLFCDEDGRVYFYWGCTNTEPIYGVELDPLTMHPLTEPIPLINSHAELYGFERTGDNHRPPKSEEEIQSISSQLLAQIRENPQIGKDMLGDSAVPIEQFVPRMMGNAPYVEGAWMTKYKGRYYLQYAVTGTQYNIYNDCVYIGDRPLGPFEIADNNPYSYKPGGFINGAGHGSTIIDKEGNFWHAASMRISCNHMFERRLGLWKAGIDEDGDLYCDQRYADWPVRADAKPFDKPDWMLLSYKKCVTASSGNGCEYITDENIRTWWKAEPNQSGQWVQVDLGKEQKVHAIQINFMDDDLMADELPYGAHPVNLAMEERYIDTTDRRTRWLLEGSINGNDYFTIKDLRNAESDLPHDLVIIPEGDMIRYIKLTVLELPFDEIPCVSAIRVFGTGGEELPEKINEAKIKQISELDFEVKWAEVPAVGYNILWGYRPQKLYHSCMVFDSCKYILSAIRKNQSCYIRIDTFNEAGITEGEVIQLA